MDIVFAVTIFILALLVLILYMDVRNTETYHHGRYPESNHIGQVHEHTYADSYEKDYAPIVNKMDDQGSYSMRQYMAN